MIADAGNIYSAVQAVCAETLRLPLDRITPEARFVQDLNADSLFIVQLAIAVEDHFHITVTEEDSRQLETVREMSDFVAKQVCLYDTTVLNSP